MKENKKLLDKRDILQYSKILAKQVNASFAKFKQKHNSALLFNFTDKETFDRGALDKMEIPNNLLVDLLKHKSKLFNEQEIQIAVYLAMLQTPYLEDTELKTTKELIELDYDSILSNLEQNYDNFKAITDALYSFLRNTGKMSELISLINGAISLVNKKSKIFNQILNEKDVELKLILLNELTDTINNEDESLIIKQTALNFIFSGLIPVNKNFIKATFAEGDQDFKFTDFDWKTANYLLISYLNKGDLHDIIFLDNKNAVNLNEWGKFSMAYHLICLIVNSFNDNLEPVRTDEQNFKDWNDILDHWKGDRVLSTLFFNDYSFTNNKSIDDFVCKKRTHLAEKQLSALTKNVSNQDKLNSYIGDDIMNDIIKQFYNYSSGATDLKISDDLEDKDQLVIKSMLSRSVTFFLTVMKHKFRLKTFKQLYKKETDYMRYNDILEEILLTLGSMSEDFIANYNNLIQTTLKVLRKYINNDYFKFLNLAEDQESLIYKSMYERGNKSAFPFSTTYDITKVNSEYLTDFSVKVKSQESNELLIYMGNVLSGSYYDKVNTKLKIHEVLSNISDFDFNDQLIAIMLRATLYQTTGVSRLHNSKVPIYSSEDGIFKDVLTDSKINRERPIVFNTKINVDSFIWEKKLKELINTPESLKKTQWGPYSIQNGLGFHSLWQRKNDEEILKILTDRNGDNFNYLQKYEKYGLNRKGTATSMFKTIKIFKDKNDLNEKIVTFAGDVSGFDTAFDKTDLLNYSIGISLVFNNDPIIITHYLLSIIPHFNIPVTHRGQSYLTYIEGLRSGLAHTSTAGDSKCENVEHLIFLDSDLNILEYIDNWLEASDKFYKDIIVNLELPEELTAFNASLLSAWPFQHASDDILVVSPFGDKYPQYSKYFNLELSEAKDSANFSGVVDYLQIYHDSSSIINQVLRMILSVFLIDKAAWEARDYRPLKNTESEYSYEDVKTLVSKMGNIDLNSIMSKLETLEIDNLNHWLNFKREIIDFIPDITDQRNWGLFSAVLINPEFIKGRSIGKFLNPEMTKNVPDIIDFLGLVARCYNSSIIIPAFWSNSLATDYVNKLMKKFLPSLSKNLNSVSSDEIRSSVELFISHLTKTLQKINEVTEAKVSITDLNLPFNFSRELIEALNNLDMEEDPNSPSFGVPPVHNPENLEYLAAMVLNFIVIMNKK